MSGSGKSLSIRIRCSYKTVKFDVRCLSDYGAVNKVIGKVSEMKENIEAAKTAAEAFLIRERRFGLSPFDYSSIDNDSSAFMPFYRLWSLCFDVRNGEEEWTTVSPLSKLDADEIFLTMSKWKTEVRMKRYYY